MSANEKSSVCDSQINQQKVPAWLTADIFEDHLRNNLSGYKKTTNFKAFPALAVGENYATLMLRVEIEVELEDNNTSSLSYMLKVPLENPIFKEMMKQNIFEIEQSMYMDIIPELEQMLGAVGVEVKFGPLCFQLKKDKDIDCLLLEDLRPRGFKNANRLEGFDMEHTKSVLTKLAQWHAASATRVQTKGWYAECFNHGFLINCNKTAIEGVYKGIEKQLTECLKNYNGQEVYGASMLQTQICLVDELYKLENIDENEFNVLNHGDCWSNNIMFQYDNLGNIKETYLVDYQIPKFGSPAQDLLYFLLSSTKLELKLNHFDYFIRFYYEHLTKYLKLLRYPKKIPTLKDIHSMLIKYGLWGYNTAIGVMTAVLLEPNNKANMDTYLSDDDDGNELKMLMFSNSRYVKHIEAILPWLYNRGVFEF